VTYTSVSDYLTCMTEDARWALERILFKEKHSAES
jgi:hypothetical protein